jgi:hypothetical protein
MLVRPLEQIASEDIDALIGNQVRESRTLEYKRDLPGNSDADKREFLADVSSFANTSGGDLLFGIDEAGGVAASVTGVSAANLDAEIRRLDSILETGLEPRISYGVRQIHHSSGAKLLLIRVRESWLGPHRVVFKGHDRFYARNSAGKYPMDVIELRDAFLRRASVGERIRAFRAERLAALKIESTPVPIKSGAKLVMHLVPFESFSAPQQLDVHKYYDNSHLMMPMSSQERIGGSRSKGWLPTLISRAPH